jgi:hypothetical protein
MENLLAIQFTLFGRGGNPNSQPYPSQHLGSPSSLCHFWEVSGLEVDLVRQESARTRLLECKSGRTIDGSWLQPQLAAAETLKAGAVGQAFQPILVYGGQKTARAKA